MTLTPSSFARATISIRFLDETACAILLCGVVSFRNVNYLVMLGEHSLCGVGLVVHQEEIEVADIVDEECLMARGHHVSGLLVVAIANLKFIKH